MVLMLLQYDTSKVFREENSGTDRTSYNIGTHLESLFYGREQILQKFVPGSKYFAKYGPGGQNYVRQAGRYRKC